jgi:zinc transport system substrate-binding protein
MKKIIILITALSLIILASAIWWLMSSDSATPGQDSEKTNIMVSILPQVDFVERIAGDSVNVTAMIPPGFSPATYDPSPEQLKHLQNAQIYFRIGHIPFEEAQMSRLQKINPSMKVIDTSSGINLLTLPSHDHEEDEDSHGHEEEAENNHDHEESGDDPHIWLSPQLVKIQAQHIYNALVAHSPDKKDQFTTNYNQFIKDLDKLDQKLTQTFLPINNKNILVFHPAFGYLANAYNFNQVAIEIEGKDPSPTQLQEIIQLARKDDAKVIFVQKQFSTKSAQAVAKEIGGAVAPIDPLAQDYFDNLREMADIIVSSLNDN